MATSASTGAVVRVSPRRSGERTIRPGDSRAKLTAEEIELIRRLGNNGHKGARIAEWFGVSQSQVSRIVRNQSWKQYER